MNFRDMSVADWIETATLATVLIGTAAGALNRWAVANKHDRLATITGAAARAAGRVNADLVGLPAGTNSWKDTKAGLVKAEATALSTEFAGTLGKLPGATTDKVAGMIEGELGKLVVPPSVAVAA